MMEQEIVKKLESKFECLTHIAFDKTDSNGAYIFSCIDSDKPSELVVFRDGWVISKVKGKRFYDILGTIIF